MTSQNQYTSGILLDSQGNALLLNGYAILVKQYLKFTQANANIVERCNYTTLVNGVTVSATGSYGRASFIFPVESGKAYTLEFDSVAVDGYKMLYVSNKAYESGEGWSGTYTTIGLGTDGHKSYTFTSNSTTLWLGIYASANTSDGTITLTNVELK